MNEFERASVLLVEYDNMLRAIEIHQLELRRYQTYLTYLVSLGSVALSAVTGTSGVDVSAVLEPILQVLLAPVAPLLLLVLSFAAVETQQMYVHARQIENLEVRINGLAGEELLTWEHKVAIRVYQRSERRDTSKERVFQVVRFNSTYVLGPLAFLLLIGTTVVTTHFLVETFGTFAGTGYVGLVVYLAGVVGFSWAKVYRNMREGGPLFNLFDSLLAESKPDGDG